MSLAYEASMFPLHYPAICGTYFTKPTPEVKYYFREEEKNNEGEKVVFQAPSYSPCGLHWGVEPQHRFIN